MKYSRALIALLAGALACNDDAEQFDAGPDATVSTTGPSTGLLDAGQPAMDASLAPDSAAARANPDAPPATMNGKKLYTVRFDSRAGAGPFACGKQVTVGTKATVVEPVDIRFFVHDVTLVRANGERVPLTLYQDERWQRDNVALLDFADDTGKCQTGDADIRNVVHGYADEHTDYTGLAFKVGVPPDKNHLDGADAPAPYNASGLWWSWAGGYKYMRIDLTSAVQPIWYFHGGAANCTGSVKAGFSCAALQIAQIELPKYDPAASLVVFDAARFYAASDVTVKDDTPGCMGFEGDTQCAPLYNTLGVVPWNDAASRPAQTAFVLAAGPALTGAKGQVVPQRANEDPTAWPDPTFARPAALDVPNVSKAGEHRSHPPQDARHGVNCMRCHQAQGPGLGKFTAAGTLFGQDGKPASNAKVELFSGKVVGYGKYENVVSQAILDVDTNGNFFTTAPLPLDTTELSARVLDATGTAVMTMPFTQQTAACNNCHLAGFRLTLPAPKQ